MGLRRALAGRAVGLRQALARLVARLLVSPYLRVRVEGLERLPPGPAVLCFSHANWADPIVLLAALPTRPTTYFFGPLEADMSRGLRNRLMRWSALAVPAPPGQPLAAVRRTEAILAAGNRLAIAGEGRIHAHEREILPLLEGPAYVAVRAGVPLVPVAMARLRPSGHDPDRGPDPPPGGGAASRGGARADGGMSDAAPRARRRRPPCPRAGAAGALADGALQRLAWRPATLSPTRWAQ